jgi:hypothetical protein
MFLSLVKGATAYLRRRCPRLLKGQLRPYSRLSLSRCLKLESPPRDLVVFPLRVYQQPISKRPYSGVSNGLIFNRNFRSFGPYADIRPKPKFGAFDLNRGVANELFSPPTARRFATSYFAELE